MTRRAPAALALAAVALAGCDAAGPSIPMPAPPMAAITTGERHTCGLGAEGEAWCWGDGAEGQLGTGERVSWRFATPVAAPAPFTALDAGGAHTCALTAEGEAWCWGSNASGQLGVAGVARSAEPRAVATSLRFRAITAGRAHTCALDLDAAAWCWGLGDRGRLGAGYALAGTTTPLAVAGELRFTAISAGGAHTCAVAEGGAAWCWGANDVSQLGNGIRGQPGDEELAPSRADARFAFASVSAGDLHSCGMDRQGFPYCWGENRGGEIGNTTVYEPGLAAEPRPVPVSTFGTRYTDARAGRHFSCGVRDQGELMCWGRGTSGELGNGEMKDWYLPQLVIPEPGRRFTPGRGPFVAVDASLGGHACALDRDGQALCWGRGEHGQLGSGEALSVLPHPVRIAGP